MSEATIRDVAEKAGVSLGTVSRVLNNAGNVGQDLYEKTMCAVKELNYRPIRQSIERKKMRRQALDIGVLFPEMSESWYGKPSFSSYMKGIEKVCLERGRDVVLFMKTDVQLTQGVSELKEKVSGVLLKSNAPNFPLASALAQALPVVGMNTLQPGWPFPQVAFDNYGAGMLAAQKLLDAGHRRIAFVNDRPNHPMFIARGLGYTEMMKRNGIFDSRLAIEGSERCHCDSNPMGSFPNMDLFLQRVMDLKATAVIAANDWMAMGLYESCRKAGVEMPGDLSCVGFDDVETAMNEIAIPGLSTVAMPFQEVAELSANLLLDIVEESARYMKGSPLVHYLPGSFVARDSIRRL